ncbi:MAG: sulfatase [Anaerolineales bacterium]|nr:sulfatase [Anaerolineales bacterium]
MKRSIILGLIVTFILASCAPASQSIPYNPPTPVISHSPTVLDIDIESPASTERLKDSRPNIIFILTDDQPYHTVDYMPFVKNELMANGVVFENGLVTTPLCCPSRASIFSGQYAHNHQVLNNTLPRGGASKFNDEDCVAIWLQEAGYRTAYFGKYMNGYEDIEPRGYVPPGWDVWKAFLGKNLDTNEDAGNLQYYFNFSMSENGSEVEYPRSRENFSTDVVTNNALAFIREARDEPFFMAIGYYNPHSPYVSAPRHREAFRSSDTDYWDWVPYRPPNFNEEDIRDKPDYIGDLSPLSPTELDTAHKQILRSLLSVDDGVASIVAALKKAGLDQNTIIVYMSDNGLTIGDHRFGASKNCPYEACIKVPFIVYAPAYYQARVDSQLVANIDIAPTFAELGGATIPDSVDGMSIVSLLENPASNWRDEILIEHWPTDQGVGSVIPEFYSIRTQAWKYTEYVTGEVELYNLVNDPFELLNAAGKKDYKEIQAELALKLQELKKR